MTRHLRILAAVLAALLALAACGAALAEDHPEGYHPEGYQLTQMVVLSRHNIRAPLSNSGSAVAELTPHTWTNWTANDSELTLKGGVNETVMGQYFRKWLESEGLIPENYQPEEDEVFFYANARQRTIATARYFASGMLPIGNVEIEYEGEIGDTDPNFKPVLTFVNDAYIDAVEKQLREQLQDGGALQAALTEDFALLADTIDYEQSNGFKSGTYTAWTTDDIGLKLEEDKEASVTGSLKTAMAASDALVLQYYEMDDATEAAFGHELTAEQWEKIADVNTIHQMLRYSAPILGVNGGHPMLELILDELQNEDRKFTFLCGHDSNVATVLGALDASDYHLPETIETRTPIGCKLVFEKWQDQNGEALARVRLIYPTTEQLRSSAPLSLENPPMAFDIDLPGLERNADGFYRLEDVEDSLQKAIDAYETLIETYGDAAVAPAA